MRRGDCRSRTDGTCSARQAPQQGRLRSLVLPAPGAAQRPAQRSKRLPCRPGRRGRARPLLVAARAWMSLRRRPRSRRARSRCRPCRARPTRLPRRAGGTLTGRMGTPAAARQRQRGPRARSALPCCPGWRPTPVRRRPTSRRRVAACSARLPATRTKTLPRGGFVAPRPPRRRRRLIETRVQPARSMRMGRLRWALMLRPLRRPEKRRRRPRRRRPPAAGPAGQRTRLRQACGPAARQGPDTIRRRRAQRRASPTARASLLARMRTAPWGRARALWRPSEGRRRRRRRCLSWRTRTSRSRLAQGRARPRCRRCGRRLRRRRRRRLRCHSLRSTHGALTPRTTPLGRAAWLLARPPAAPRGASQLADGGRRGAQPPT